MAIKIKIPNPIPYRVPIQLGRRGPEHELTDLFERVQHERLFPDGKTFADMAPAERVRKIRAEYKLASKDPNFNLQEFVSRHFYQFDDETEKYVTDRSKSPREHINGLWDVLTRETKKSTGSLLALPHPYVVPGGRFNEQFYWDSYFIMLGLAADNRWDMIEDMIDNYAFMLRKYGLIPTANRTYFLSRSQPPFLSHMIRLLATHDTGLVYAHYLPVMLAEYHFWMSSSAKLTDEKPARHRVVKLPNGEILNRYFDNSPRPRPESLKEDINTAHIADNPLKWTFTELRAAAESGWDFSSRWLENPEDLATIQTTEIVPVDLNCLLYDLEQLIAFTYENLKQKTLAEKFALAAEIRAEAIQRYCWHNDDGFYYDYSFADFRQTGHKTLAGIFPLWVKIASQEQATRVAETLEQEFLKPGGLVTTLTETGQQWDAPNGWAPLQWIAIEGLRNYGFAELANKIKRRWIDVCVREYKSSGKMVEKYNVVDIDTRGGGGEYPLQDGFGWTNGVLAALLAEDEKH